MMKKNPIKSAVSDSQNFWQSYSDMMAALLLVFVLIIAVSISYTKSVYEEKQAEVEKRNQEITEYKEILDQKQEEIEKQQKALREQQEAFDYQQEQIDSILGIRTTLITSLKNEFENTDMNINVDPESGAISFDSSILFDTDRSDLKESGKKFLDEFFPMYFEVILGDELRQYVAEVIIEGHTDNRGTYLYNLDLSQKRALGVAKYCLNERSGMFDADTLEEIKSLVTANGRSFYELKYKEDGSVDLDASRRVEIKFRLREDDMIKQMMEILE